VIKNIGDMTTEEKREQTIQGLANMLRTSPFQVEFKVKKKPAGIKVIIEVTQEQMDGITKQTLEKTKRIEQVK
jgi:hypothetical protein